MSFGKLARLLALGSLLCGGCLVEPSQNAPATNSAAAGSDSRAAAAASPSPAISPSPQVSPGSSDVGEAGGEI